MKNAIPPLLAGVLAAALAGCAHLRTTPQDPLEASVRELNSLCMARAMSVLQLIPEGATADQRREIAFRDYWESFLNAKGQGEYVGCLRKRYRAPWLHSDYRTARRWLRSAEKHRAKYEPLAGADLRVADAAETFRSKDAKTGVRRVTITLADGRSRVFEEEFPSAPQL